jgi:hypothetical protein
MLVDISHFKPLTSLFSDTFLLHLLGLNVTLNDVTHQIFLGNFENSIQLLEDKGLFRTAIILSQIGSDEFFNSLLSDQISMWEQNLPQSTGFKLESFFGMFGGINRTDDLEKIDELEELFRHYWVGHNQTAAIGAIISSRSRPYLQEILQFCRIFTRNERSTTDIIAFLNSDKLDPCSRYMFLIIFESLDLLNPRASTSSIIRNQLLFHFLQFRKYHVSLFLAEQLDYYFPGLNSVKNLIFLFPDEMNSHLQNTTGQAHRWSKDSRVIFQSYNFWSKEQVQHLIDMEEWKYVNDALVSILEASNVIPTRCMMESFQFLEKQVHSGRVEIVLFRVFANFVKLENEIKNGSILVDLHSLCDSLNRDIGLLLAQITDTSMVNFQLALEELARRVYEIHSVIVGVEKDGSHYHHQLTSF